jgi:hypothetical protein
MVPQWFLELWDASHAVLGVIAIVAIQRTIQKILIAVFLTREFKHDETNRAWWTGKWSGRGLGNSAMSQPAREFIVKIVEMSLWSSDFLIAHILLIILTPPILIPFFDTLHSTMLCESRLTNFDHCIVLTMPFSLASSLQTDSSPIVLNQTKETTSMDCLSIPSRFITGSLTVDSTDHQVHHCLHYRDVLLGIVAGLTCVIFVILCREYSFTEFLQRPSCVIASTLAALYVRISNDLTFSITSCIGIRLTSISIYQLDGATIIRFAAFQLPIWTPHFHHCNHSLP